MDTYLWLFGILTKSAKLQWSEDQTCDMFLQK